MFGLSSLATTAIGAAVIAAMAFAGGMRVEYKIESGKIAALQLEYAQAEIKAQQKYDATSLNAAKAENDAQTKLTSQGNLAIPEVINHVSIKTVPCIPYGLVRLLDAAASGRTANSLVLPAGKSDGTCSPITVDALGRSVVGNYYTARANATQLNGLIAGIRAARP
jgi:hypothetical protein